MKEGEEGEVKEGEEVKESEEVKDSGEDQEFHLRVGALNALT